MPELLDVRDENGNLTGETMVRSQVHQNELWHAVVLIWIYNSNGQILLQRRAAHLNAFPEKYDVTTSGHISASEKPRQTAVRELAEELGIYAAEGELEEVETLSDSFALTYGKQHREHDYIYLLKKDDIDISKLRLQAAEVLEVAWILPGDLERDMADPINGSRYSSRDPLVYKLIINKMRQLLSNAHSGVAGDPHAHAL